MDNCGKRTGGCAGAASSEERVGSPGGLFRTEVLALAGNQPWQAPLVASKASSWAISLAVVGCIGSLLFFAGTFQFAVKEQGIGRLVPTGGWSRVIANRAGAVSQIAVKPGEDVRVGDVLFVITTGEGADGDVTVGARLLEAVEGHREALTRQWAATKRRNAEDARLATVDLGLLRRRMIRQRAENRTHKQRLAVSLTRLNRARELRASNALSQATLLELIDEVAARSGVLAMKEGVLLDLHAKLRAKDVERSHLQLSLQEERAMFDSELEALSMEETAIRREHMATIISPTSGVTSSIKVRVGDWVQPSDILADILSRPLEFKAELALGSGSMGNVELGQSVNVYIDAFPVETYGAQHGEVRHISETTLEDGIVSDVHADFARVSGGTFLVEVGFPNGFDLDEGAQSALRAGMTVRADLVTHHRTLADWALAPLRRGRARL